jgi:S1-C subfamily serine protease
LDVKVSIRHLGGERDGTVDQFLGRDRLAIGSEGSEADVRLPVAEAKAPNEYAEICFDGKCYLMRTKEGAPVTRVNGHRIESVTLENGDVIEFGEEGGPKLEFKYELVVPDELAAPKQIRLYRRFLRMRAIFTLVALVLVAFLAVVTIRMLRQEARVRDRFAEQERSHALELQAQEAVLSEYLARFQEEQRQDLARRLQEEAVRTRSEVDRLEEEILAESESRLESRLVDLQKALDSRDEVEIESLSREIEGLRAELGRNAPVTRVFQKILRENDAAVLLLYTEYDAIVKTPSGEVTRKSSGWGTGFFVTPEGHIVTNKHVVQPWKFDPQFAALEALGLARADESTLRISAWAGGSPAFNEQKEPDFTVGFNNHALGNLALFKAAPDEMETASIVLPDGASLQGRLHRSDNNDLAILKAEGGPFPTVRVKEEAGVAKVAKLDPVMVIGFPRGRGILERRVAETSPSTGVVRKVEDTIYVTASIIPGNSGGPLFTLDGEVIGVCTRVYSETLGICIRIEHAMKLLP